MITLRGFIDGNLPVFFAIGSLLRVTEDRHKSLPTALLLLFQARLACCNLTTIILRRSIHALRSGDGCSAALPRGYSARLLFCVAEPETALLNLRDEKNHLGDGVGPTHQETSLELEPPLVRLEFGGVGGIDVEVGCLVIFDLSDVVSDFLGSHNLPDAPTDYGCFQAHNESVTLTCVLECTMYLKRLDPLADVPPAEDLLNLGRALAHVRLKHLLAHAFDLDEAVAETLGHIACNDVPLEALEEEVQAHEAVETLPDDVALQVLLDRGCRPVKLSGATLLMMHLLQLIQLDH